MTIESFLFCVDRLQKLHGLSRQQVFREFHILLAGAATNWYWQLIEDKTEDYDFNYYSLTQEMERPFSTTGSDLMKSQGINGTQARTARNLQRLCLRYAQLAFQT